MIYLLKLHNIAASPTTLNDIFIAAKVGVAVWPSLQGHVQLLSNDVSSACIVFGTDSSAAVVSCGYRDRNDRGPVYRRVADAGN